MFGCPWLESSFHVIPDVSAAPFPMLGIVTPVPGIFKSARAGGVAGSAPIHAEVSLPVLSNSSLPAAGAPFATVPVIKLSLSVFEAATPATSLFGIVMSKAQVVCGVAPPLMDFWSVSVAV